MTADPNFDINENWRWLLQEVILAKHAWIADGPISLGVGKGLLDILLPPILYIRAVSFFDEALGKYIDDQRYSVPPRGATTLHLKLCVLDSAGALQYSQDLRDIKDRRNLLAHRSTTPDAWVQDSATWDELDQAIARLEAALQHLQLIGPRPDFQFFWNRNVDSYFKDPHPTKPDVAMITTFNFGVREGDQKVIETTQAYESKRR